MAKNNSYVHEFGAEYGKPVEFVPADHAIEMLKDSGLPPVLFEYWKGYGFSKYQGGYFQLINPLDYEQVVAEWIKGTPFEGADRFFAIRMDAFGDLRVWGVRLGNAFDISVSYHALYRTGFNHEAKIRAGRGGRTIEGQLYGGSVDKITLDSDDPRIVLFLQAKEALGVLGPNQIYGLVPAAPLGGQMQLDNLQITDAPAYLALLPELAPVRVMTMQDLARTAFGDTAAQSLNKLLKE